MKCKEFLRRLKQHGVTITGNRGKGGHVLAEYGSKAATIPKHGAKDMAPEFLKEICKQLGLNPRQVL
jgi:predicted RNA binding protein YcfA (HicA-like mRNA interferase family)